MRALIEINQYRPKMRLLNILKRIWEKPLEFKISLADSVTWYLLFFFLSFFFYQSNRPFARSPLYFSTLESHRPVGDLHLVSFLFLFLNPSGVSFHYYLDVFSGLKPGSFHLSRCVFCFH